MYVDGSVGKESTHNTGDTGELGSISGPGRFPGGRNGNPLQYSCLKNPMDRGLWWSTVHGVGKSQRRQNTVHNIKCIVMHFKVNNTCLTNKLCFLFFPIESESTLADARGQGVGAWKRGMAS